MVKEYANIASGIARNAAGVTCGVSLRKIRSFTSHAGNTIGGVIVGLGISTIGYFANSF